MLDDEGFEFREEFCSLPQLDSLSPTFPPTHWVLDPTVECLEVE